MSILDGLTCDTSGVVQISAHHGDGVALSVNMSHSADNCAVNLRIR